MNAFTFFDSGSNAMPPLTGLGWLGQTPLDELPEAVRRRLEEARTEGEREGYRRGREKNHLDIQTAYQRGQLEAEERLKAHYEEQVRALDQQRTEARLKEAEERGLLFDRMLKEKEKAIEERLRAEWAQSGDRQVGSPRAIKVSTVNRGSVDAAKLEAVRRQGFQEGQEAMRRELEGMLRDARRQGFQEGVADARRASFGIEGSRSWALGILHLPEGCSPEEVRQRYRKLSRCLHPDHNPGLEDLFIKNLNRAKDLLGD